MGSADTPDEMLRSLESALLPQQPVEQQPVEAKIGVLDIKGKLVVLKAGDHTNENDRAILLTHLAPVLKEAGAALVVMLSPGADIATLSDEDLTKLGLRRIDDNGHG